MTQFIESLRRLYNDGKVSDETLKKFLASNKITQQEYAYIISANNAI